MASRMAPAVYDQTQAEIEGGDYIFRANGSVLAFDGFYKIWPREENGESDLPELSDDEDLEYHAIKPEQQPKMGTVVHRRIVEAKGGQDSGTLVVDTDWLKPDGNALVKEHTEFAFRGDAQSRTIDRTTTLTALGEKVIFKDNKEAFYGMRVARELELPYDKAEVLTDASGKPTSKPIMDNAGVSGQYTSSEGLQGDAVWGQRAHWMMLTGTVQNEPVTIAMLDKPSNPNFPAFWHARGYGLFAINPLGEKVLPGGGKRDFDLTLEPGKSATFHYRVLILGGTAKPADIEKAYQSFAK